MHGPVTVIPDSGGLGAHGRPLALGLCPSGVALGRADPGYEPSPLEQAFSGPARREPRSPRGSPDSQVGCRSLSF